MTKHDDPHEVWKPIPGFDGLYECSDLGRVRSLDRTVPTKAGYTKVLRGKVLTPHRMKSGHLTVLLYREGRHPFLVHRLVLLTFVGPCPEGREACHWDDKPENNTLTNLRWGTRSENSLDKTRNGKGRWSNRTHCNHGHELTPENLGSRNRCKTCKSIENRQRYVNT